MFLLYGGGSGSPIEARQTAPIFLIILFFLIIVAFLVLVAFLFKRAQIYKTSEKYLQKEQSRKTKYSDVVKLCKNNNFKAEDQAILWEVCQVTQCTNILYILQKNSDVLDLFRQAYNLMLEKKLFTDVKMNNFFNCLYKLELMVAQTKKIVSTQQIPLQSMVFYITEEGEQLPFTVIQNDKDFFTVEIPDFLYNSPRKPQLLIRSRFNYKTSDGLSYNFVSRIVRYDTNQEGVYKAIIAFTDKLECQAQRHFKREFIQEKCIFSSVTPDPKANVKKGEDPYKYFDKMYMGKLSNISGGGCCIQTKLPIKEKQHICIILPTMGIDEKIVGMIRKTRKLPSGLFALHIQFEKISMKAKNRIFTLVYKFEL
ncbi:MAG: PilZ domain-containing protein [Treponema sp.]|nr:PilZ domain-containing protein [Treponema sp.]